MSKKSIREIILLLSNPRIFIFTILWMMVLVVLGTLAQRDLGLYDAQQMYFSCWITWLGPIPTPGGRFVLFLMFFNMIFFLLKPNFWSRKKIGIITIHMGVILLLLGGGITAWFSSEGNMVIREGESSNFIVDLYAKELAIINQENNEDGEVISISANLLMDGNYIDNSLLPFTIEILNYYTNCQPYKRDEIVEAEYKGFAQNFILQSIPNEKEAEMNRAGVTLKINGSDEDGIYSLFIDQKISQTININQKELIISLRRKRTYLPFELKLNDFKKVLHPGTEIAKGFSSDVILIDDKVARSVLIQMNEPLRYMNYTFYQSSFSEGPNIDTTILSVVKNYGRLFPYISSLIISLGLLIHIIMKLPILFNKRKRVL